VKNLQAKTRDIENPYAIFYAGNWEWRVLKRYQSPDGEKKNEYARWLCAVQSPHTYGGWDMGDTYISDIPNAKAGMALGGENGLECVKVYDLAAQVREIVLDPKAWG